MDPGSIDDPRAGTGSSCRQSPGVKKTFQEHADEIIRQYLLEKVPEFAKLSDLSRQCGENPHAASYFRQQRKRADEATERRQKEFFFAMMRIAEELDDATGAFSDAGVKSIRSPAANADPVKILDMCMAPGGFLAAVLKRYQNARVLAFTLPVEMGGHKIWLKPRGRRVDVRQMDITMLAADMGLSLSEVPAEHEDRGKFLPRKIESTRAFNLAICDGQVLRTHSRASYRNKTEPDRLHAVQLALGLEHLRPGGTMVVRLHRAESWTTVLLLRTFCKFSRVQLYKPKTAHKIKPSFYLVSTEVDSRGEEAVHAVEEWKAVWKAGTFSATYEDYLTALQAAQPTVEAVLQEFGEQLISLGRDVWANQAEALANSRFLRAKPATANPSENGSGLEAAVHAAAVAEGSFPHLAGPLQNVAQAMAD